MSDETPCGATEDDEPIAKILGDLIDMVRWKAGPDCPVDYLAALLAYEWDGARFSAGTVSDMTSTDLTTALVRDSTGGEIAMTRGRGVVAVQATDASGKVVALVFTADQMVELCAESALMSQQARRNARVEELKGP